MLICTILCIASAIIGATLTAFILAAFAIGKRADRKTEEFYAAVAREHYLEPKS
jgi:hypothetical protein